VFVLYDADMQAEIEGIDWTAVDDLDCGIELEVSGDARHHQLMHSDGVDGETIPGFGFSFNLVLSC